MFGGGGFSVVSNQAKPSYSVFTVDDTLSELEQCKRYSLSQLPLIRLHHVRRLTNCARAVGVNDTIIHLLPLLKKLVADNEMLVRQALAEELGKLAVFLARPQVPAVTPASFDENGEALPPLVAYASGETPRYSVLSPASFSSFNIPSLLTPSTEETKAAEQQPPTQQPSSDIKQEEPPRGDTEAEKPMDTTEKPVDTTEKPMDTTEKPMDTTEKDTADSGQDTTEVTKETEQQTTTEPTTTPAPTTTVPTTTTTPPTTATPPPTTTEAELKDTDMPQAKPRAPETDSPGYVYIKNAIIPAVQTLLIDPEADVRQAASQSLNQIAEVLTGDDVGTLVLTLVLCLAHDEHDEQRMIAVALMDILAPRLGAELVMNYVALELAAFADDSTFRVRKVTAQSFGNVCTVVGPEFTVRKLLPSFERLSRDMIWGVRKGCIDSLVAVTKVLPPAVQASVAVPIIERFLADASRWVRNGAFEVLGVFLHALGSELVTPTLLKHFTGIPSMSDSEVDGEVNYYCAFNFPAVVQTVTRARWSELAECFGLLVKDRKFHVRRCLACSLHIVAEILGTELTEQYLLPAADVFLKDIDEVRVGVVKHLSSLLAVISPSKREKYIEVLWEVQRHNDVWRWKSHLARQMGLFANLFPIARVSTDIRQILFALIIDNAASVRNIACESMGALLLRLHKDDPKAYEECLRQHLDFSTSATFLRRQLFVRMCEGIVVSHDASVPSLLPHLLRLARDPISNVRLAVAQLTRRSLWEKETFAALQPQVAQILHVLSKDEDRDIKALGQVVSATGATSMDEFEDEVRPSRKPVKSTQTNKESSGAWL